MTPSGPKRLESTFILQRHFNPLCRYSLLGLSGIWFRSVHDLLDSYYRSIEADNESIAIVNELRSCIKRALTKTENKEKKLMKQINDSESAQEVQKKGELIIANLHKYFFVILNKIKLFVLVMFLEALYYLLLIGQLVSPLK